MDTLLSSDVELVVIGAPTAVGALLLDVLSEAGISRRRVQALQTEDSPRQLVDYGADDLELMSARDFEFRHAMVVFVAVADPGALAAAEAALDADALVIDCAGAMADDPRTLPLVAELNAEMLSPGVSPVLVSCPSGLESILALALAPLARVAGLVRVRAVVCESAGGLGSEALQALDEETRGLLTFKSPETPFFGQQLAFNLLPDSLTPPLAEVREGDDLASVLDLPRLDLQVMRLRSPVFHGDLAALFVETENPLDSSSVANAYADVAWLQVCALEKPVKGPAHVAPDPERIELQGPVFEAGGHDCRLWVVADLPKRGLVLNALRVAGVLIKEYL